MYYRQMPPEMMWYQGPMGNMYDPTMEEEDEQDLAMLYPGIYHRVMPMVMYYGDQMEKRYGTMYCPTREEMGKITDDIYDRLGMDISIDEQDENEEGSRQRPGRSGIGRDLISILFLRELHRRRRRRRRRRPHGGY